MADSRRLSNERRKRAPAVKDPARHTGILVVEDSPVDRAIVDKILENDRGWRVSHAGNGREAVDALQRVKPDLILTDMIMEEMDGLALVEAVREAQPRLPVVLMTAYGNEEIALKALKLGAASYVPKRCLDRDLIHTLEEVLAASHAHRRRERLQNYLGSLESHFVLDNDPTLVRALVAQLQDDLARLQWPERDCVRIGIALEEAVVNAISHGNLEVSTSTRLQSDQRYRALLEERRRQTPYRDRHLHVAAQLSRRKARFVIRDEGPGFSPTSLPDASDPATLDCPTGRGLLLIRTFMDEVKHNGAGNEIVMIKRNLVSGEW